jgi:hypothetical protein
MDEEFNFGNTNDYNTSTWGWNIAYSSGQPLSCEIWTGVVDECDLQSGVQVGTFEIDDCSVTWNFFDAYESNDFNFYAGPCEGSDGGAFLSNGGDCDTSDIKENAAAPGSFPLQASNDFGALSTFSFSGCANSNEDTYLESMPWGMFGFDVFPLGGSGRGFLTAHAKVCPVGVDRDVLPTQSPTEAPSPTPQPVATDTPVTVDVRSKQPVSAPTKTPSFGPTFGPTNIPISRRTSSPTVLPDTKAPVTARSIPPVSFPTNSNCETAYVYCPGYSTCFQDENFNSGRDIITTNQEDSWGWNIEYICGGTLHCEIWSGAKDCNFQKGRKVGRFEFNEHGATYSLFNGYQSNQFNLYAGQCEGNDGGKFVTNGRWCLPSNIAESARVPESYPLVTNGAFAPVSRFTFSSSNEGNYLNEAVWGENDYDVFPLGRIGRHWLTANLEVCTVAH